MYGVLKERTLAGGWQKGNPEVYTEKLLRIVESDNVGGKKQKILLKKVQE